MSRRTRMLTGYLAALLLAGPLPPRCEAKSYSSGGGHSYSSSHSSSSGGGHSFSSGSHSFSSGSSRSSGGGSTRTSGSSSSGSHNSSSVAGASKSSGTSASRNSSSASDGSKSFKSSSGKSYNSGSSWSENDRRGYSSTKSYTSGAGHKFPSSSGSQPSVPTPVPPNKPAPSPAPASFAFDTAAAHAKKEEASKQDFTRFKEAQTPRAAAPSPSARSTSDSPSYRVKAPPISSSDGLRRPRAYIPDAITLSSRPVRIYNVFNPYYSRPVVIYRDPYDSFFWWWLLDRTLDERAWWAYHHRYDMDPARYQSLVATDQQLEARVEQLEAQQAPRDPNYVPAGLDRDLMYSDRYVEHAYSNRPTRAGAIAFWIVGVPTAIGMTWFFIWLIWFKRWSTTT